MAQLKVSGRMTSEMPASFSKMPGTGYIGQIRDDVQQREGRDREDGSASEPFELLAAKRQVGAQIADIEDDAGQHPAGGEIGVSELVQPIVEQRGGRPEVDGHDAQPTITMAGR